MGAQEDSGCQTGPLCLCHFLFFDFLLLSILSYNKNTGSSLKEIHGKDKLL